EVPHRAVPAFGCFRIRPAPRHALRVVRPDPVPRRGVRRLHADAGAEDDLVRAARSSRRRRHPVGSPSGTAWNTCSRTTGLALDAARPPSAPPITPQATANPTVAITAGPALSEAEPPT